jgi:hypothetical protein
MVDITDDRRDSDTALQTRGLVRGAVIHLLNEQPLVADLYGYPSPADSTLVCTNVRGKTGKRPVWADDPGSMFYFPWIQIRFLEIPPDGTMFGSSPAEAGRPMAVRGPAEEPELEIDEDFLRRVRDV